MLWATVALLSTALAEKVMQSVVTVRPFAFFHSIFLIS